MATGPTLVMEGTTYYRRLRHWYDSKTHMRASITVESRLDGVAQQDQNTWASCLNADVDDLKTLHRGYIEKLGVTYVGAKPIYLIPLAMAKDRDTILRLYEAIKALPQREEADLVSVDPPGAKCWGCRKPLDAGMRLRCYTCSGIVCSCGACLCGWRKSVGL